VGAKAKPYVIVQVADKDGTIKDGSRFVTEAANDCEKAEYNHSMHVAGCNVGDALVFTVKDKDIGDDSTAQDLANALLGKVTLSADLVKSGFLGELQLEQAGYNVQAFLKVKVEGRDPNPADLAWMAQAMAADAAGGKPALRHSVKVEIMDAHGLRNADFMGTSEPYCMVQVAGKGEFRSRWQTEKHKNWKAPKWHQELQIACQPGDALEFVVKDSDIGTDDILGRVTLDAEKVKKGFLGELELQDTGKKEGEPKAFLRVKVEGAEFSVVDRAILAAEEMEVKAGDEIKKVCCGIHY